MEAPTPLDNDTIISKQILSGNKFYNLKIISTLEDLFIKISPNDVEDCDFIYEIKYKLNDLYSLNKYFRQFDTIDEVIKALKNNEKIIKEKYDAKVYDIKFENNLFLIIHLYILF